VVPGCLGQRDNILSEKQTEANTKRKCNIYTFVCVCIYIYIYIYIYTRLLNNKDEIMLFKENKRNGNCHVK
jgi:hypothetical protein